MVGSTYGHFPASTWEGDTDAFVAKCDAEGHVQWTRQFGTLTTDFESGIAIEPSGQVFVAGMTSGILSNGGGLNGKYHAFVAKYRPNGQQLEIEQSGSNDFDDVLGIAVDASVRDIYVVGSTRGSLPGGGGLAGAEDGFVQHLCFTKH